MGIYTIYHAHTQLSSGVTNIDSVAKFEQYIDKAKENGMTALGFAEHGSVLQWVGKKQKIEKAHMKYIHAEEFYVTESLVPPLKRDNYHVVLIALNGDGVKELNRLSSIAFNKDDGHYYYNPRITIDELLETSDNILITTACLGGILASGTKEMQEKFLRFIVDNKHRCYLEIQHHFTDMQIKYNQYLYRISQKYDIPLIAGTDTHSLDEKQAKGRLILQKSKDVKFSSEDEFDLIFKTYDELVKAYHQQGALPKEVYLDAIENTNRMAERIEEFNLDYTKKYPKLYEDSLAVFKQKIIQGIKNRGIDKYPNFQEYKDRINHEMKAYIHNDAIDFMLLEEDYKTALKNMGVNYGYSRGSVSGSVIAYVLGITEVDSIKYNLNFDRFMNVERVSLADIDTDWFKGDRPKVREYMFGKQEVHCCNIITFNTIKLRGAIKDVGRALDMSVEETQALCNMVQEDEDGKEFIDEKIRQQYPTLFEYVDIVKDTVVSLGRHAAGLVVAPTDIDYDFGTLYISSDDKPISQINMKEIDSLNYVKLDVLGLDCVGLINKTCELANIPVLKPDNMDFTDMNVWNDIKRDNTLIFQFESDFAGDYLKTVLSDSTIENIKKINPNFSYIDLMSMASGAIRPAGASYRDELAQGKFRDNGHPVLNEFLAPTLGYLVYQEQIIAFLHQFCGFTMGEADIVRRHFSKKTGTEHDIPIIKDGGYMINDKGEKSNHYIKGFIQTMADEYNVSKEESEQIIESFLQVIIDASDYLFSLNHAEPYSFLGFATGHLRYYYPLETYTSALNIYDNAEKINAIKELIEKRGIPINPIKFGKSKAEYFCDRTDNSIYQGVASIKYCNAQIAEELYELSKNNYTNFIDLLIDINTKTSVDTRQLEILTGLGFFSDFGKNKHLLQVIKLCNGVKEKSKVIQPSLLTCKTLKKDKLESYGISEFLAKKYSNKETEKQFGEIDNIGLLKELIKQLPNESLSIAEQMRFEQDYLGNVVYFDNRVNENYYIVTDFKTFKDSTKPYLTLRQIKTGKVVRTKIKQGKIFTQTPFGQWAILSIPSFKQDFKSKKVGDQWVKTDVTEDILVEYEVIKK